MIIIHYETVYGTVRLHTANTCSLGLRIPCLHDIFLHRNRETEILKGQIDFLNDAINREEERAKELEMKSK